MDKTYCSPALTHIESICCLCRAQKLEDTYMWKTNWQRTVCFKGEVDCLCQIGRFWPANASWERKELQFKCYSGPGLVALAKRAIEKGQERKFFPFDQLSLTSCKLVSDCKEGDECLVITCAASAFQRRNWVTVNRSLPRELLVSINTPIPANHQ